MLDAAMSAAAATLLTINKGAVTLDLKSHISSHSRSNQDPFAQSDGSSILLNQPPLSQVRFTMAKAA